MKKSRVWFITIFILLIAIISYPVTQYYYTKSWENKIYPLTFINGIDVSGKEKNEAIQILKSNLKETKDGSILIKTEKRNYTLQLSKTNPQYDIEGSVNKALLYGKDLSFFKKASEIKNPKKKDLYINIKYDKNYIEKFIANIEKDINKVPINASIKTTSPGKLHITRDVEGIRLDKKNLMDNIIAKINPTSNNNEIIAKTESYSGNITEKKLKEINSIISSFSTDFSASPEGRITNIEIATNALNGILLLPGDIFSFNKIIGNTTAEKGYREAPIVINNKLEQGLGGGLCQVSTTLYNAVTMANIKPLERTNHSIPPAYIEPGFDATVSYKEIDYKFKNTLTYPIYIEGYTANGKLIFNIHSNSSLNKIEYKLINDIYEKIEPKTIYEEDATLPLGSNKKTQSSKPGYKVKVYLIGYENKKEISRHLISNDIYKPVDEIIKKGTKK